MQRFLILLGLTLFVGGTALPTHGVWAAEESEPPRANASKDGTKDGEKKTDEKPKDAAKDVSGGRFAGDPVYVHMAPMVLPVISDQGVEQLVTFQIDIEVKDFDVADHIHTIMPRVVDSLMRALYGGLGQGSLRRGKLVDVTKIKAKATAAISEVVGAEGIRDVLIQGVAQRML